MVPQNLPAGKSVVTTPKQSESEISASLRRLFLFAHRPAEMTQRLAQREILAVGVDDRIGPFEAEPPRRRIYVGLVGLNADHLGQEHVVRPERQHLPDTAFDVDG